MTGPAWWTTTVIVLLAVTTATCLAHLVAVRCRRSRAVDAVDVAMGAVMLGLVAGVPLGRGVAVAVAAGFGLVALRPAARAVRAVVAGVRVTAAGAEPGGRAVFAGGPAEHGGRQGVLCAAMAVMLVPLVVRAPGAMAGHAAMTATGADGSALAVTAALTVVVVLGVGALDVAALARAVGTRRLGSAAPTACRVAMGVTSVWMLVAMIG